MGNYVDISGKELEFLKNIVENPEGIFTIKDKKKEKGDKNGIYK